MVIDVSGKTTILSILLKKNFAYNSVAKNYISTTVFSDFKAKKIQEVRS